MKWRTRVDLAYYLIELIRKWVVPKGSALKFHLKKEVLDFYQENVSRITKEYGLKGVGN
jgi:hypothetical protein